ncbi:histone H1-like [Leptopilina boulardi]|uniref:histone H1-like n=1 Tax=Leptopilina boulardi TaxID=63433 RepID=UPI0021F55697|nr:histone H1-like [Leptopilina boulardi]
MTELSTSVGGTTPKKLSSSSNIKKPKSKPNHPKTSEMVLAAISTLNERGGSSLQAIKKYIIGTYAIDVVRLAPFIKKYLKSAVEQGDIIQTKGKGASGSFKLGSKSKISKPKKAPSNSEKIVEKAVAKKSKVTKVASTKKTAVTTKSPVKKAGTTKVKSATTKKTLTKEKAKTLPTKPKIPKSKKITPKKTR